MPRLAWPGFPQGLWGRGPQLAQWVGVGGRNMVVWGEGPSLWPGTRPSTGGRPSFHRGPPQAFRRPPRHHPSLPQGLPHLPGSGGLLLCSCTRGPLWETGLVRTEGRGPSAGPQFLPPTALPRYPQCPLPPLCVPRLSSPVRPHSRLALPASTLSSGRTVPLSPVNPRGLQPGPELQPGGISLWGAPFWLLRGGWCSEDGLFKSMSSAPGREEVVADPQGCVGGCPLCAWLSVRCPLRPQAGGGGREVDKGISASPGAGSAAKASGRAHGWLSWRARSGWKLGPEPLEAGLPSRRLCEPHFPA